MVDIKPLLPQYGAVKEVLAGFVSGSNIIRVIDESNTVDGILQVGMTITVSGGLNDGRTYTIVSWTTTTQWNGDDNITIQVSESVIDTGGMDNVKLSFSMPVNPNSLPDPLAITVHDIRVYVRDQDIEGKNYFEIAGGAMTTWDVLNNLAKQWNAKIYQNNGRWEI